jgi:hypothetical protein
MAPTAQCLPTVDFDVTRDRLNVLNIEPARFGRGGAGPRELTPKNNHDAIIGDQLLGSHFNIAVIDG